MHNTSLKSSWFNEIINIKQKKETHCQSSESKTYNEELRQGISKIIQHVLDFCPELVGFKLIPIPGSNMTGENTPSVNNSSASKWTQISYTVRPRKNRTLKQWNAASNFWGVWLVSYIFHEVWLICFWMIHCWNSSSHASLKSIVFKIECQNPFVPLYGRQVNGNNRNPMWHSFSKLRNNMVLFRYVF